MILGVICDCFVTADSKAIQTGQAGYLCSMTQFMVCHALLQDGALLPSNKLDLIHSDQLDKVS